MEVLLYVLATVYEQQQCQARRDLGNNQGKGMPLVDQKDLMRTQQVLLVLTLAIYKEYLPGCHIYLRSYLCT